MKEIHLRVFPERQVSVKFDDEYAYEFFDTFMKNFDADEIARQLGFRSGIVMMRNYRKNKYFYPLFVVKRICQVLVTIRPEFGLEEIEKYVIKLKAIGSQGKPICKPKFPFKLNIRTARLIAHTLGDGSICPSGTLKYRNSQKEVIDAFVRDLQTLGKVPYRIGYDSGAYRVYVPKIVKIILDRLGLEDETFSYVLNFHRRSKIAFVQALFDDEGTVNISGLRLAIISTNRCLLEKLCQLLSEFKITSRIKFGHEYIVTTGERRVCWTLDITGYKNFQKFHSLIKLQHPKKRQDMITLLRWYEGKETRPLRGETERKICFTLEEKPRTSCELSKVLNLNICTVRGQIRKLALKSKIFPISRVKKGIQSEIVWSTQKPSRPITTIYRFANFAKLLLKELTVPRTLKHLSQKFERTESSIEYHLKKLESLGLVKLIKMERADDQKLCSKTWKAI
jgi:hypothetical protein